MDLQTIETAYANDDRSWLASIHGTETNEGVTLSLDAFTDSDHYPNGFIPSGTIVGIISASGLAGPYDAGASDGTETAVGITYNPIPVNTGVTKAAVAVLQHGKVEVANLPIAVDTAGGPDGSDAYQADLSQIRFV